MNLQIDLLAMEARKSGSGVGSLVSVKLEEPAARVR